MKQILATVIKEWILIRRDVGGLLLLFLMPALLIIVMALVQEQPFKDYQERRFDLLLADNDGGALARQIKDGLKRTNGFNIIDSIDNAPLTEAHMKTLLQSGKYKVGILIPRGVTAEIANAANVIANEIVRNTGLNTTLPAREMRGNINIEVFYDPVMKSTFRMSINAALDKYMTYACSNELLKRISVLNSQNDTTDSGASLIRILQRIGIKEQPLHGNALNNKYINSVQHNVPAWAIFGMFFIAVPISGNMIREREEGSALRLELIPGAYRFVALGKIIFYTMICMLQFALMVAIGVWILPLLDLPALYCGAHAWILIPIAACIGFAATSYGYFVGATFKTSNQAMPFGALSVVILSAMGGVWIPTELLPPLMQKVALISPLHWAMDAVNEVLLRDSNITAILKHLGVLLTFGIVLWIASSYLNIKRQHSVH